MALLLFNASTYAFDIENGKALYNANCTRCHQENIHIRKDRSIHSFSELRERVRQCQLSAELIWFDEEIDDVAAYLNHAFYHFNIEK